MSDTTTRQIDVLGDLLERDRTPSDTMFSALGDDMYMALKSLHQKLYHGDIIIIEEVYIADCIGCGIPFEPQLIAQQGHHKLHESECSDCAEEGPQD